VRHAIWFLPAVALVGNGAAARGAAEPLAGTPNGLAATPPMSWNSLNKFGCDIDEKTVRAEADAMVPSGMREAGYTYIVIDDCWQGLRDPAGNITADAKRFPSGAPAATSTTPGKVVTPTAIASAC
jgi:alpha-galactosidase